MPSLRGPRCLLHTLLRKLCVAGSGHTGSPVCVPQRRICSNDFSQYPQKGTTACGYKGIAGSGKVILYTEFGFLPFRQQPACSRNSHLLSVTSDGTLSRGRHSSSYGPRIPQTPKAKDLGLLSGSSGSTTCSDLNLKPQPDLNGRARACLGFPREISVPDPWERPGLAGGTAQHTGCAPRSLPKSQTQV